MFTLTLDIIRRLFAKAGYNIALISRESANLHKFAAELKTGDTDVRTPPIPFIHLLIHDRRPSFHTRRVLLLIIPSSHRTDTGSCVPNIRLQLQRSPNRVPRGARTLAGLRHPRGALQRGLRRLEALPADHRGRDRPGDGLER